MAESGEERARKFMIEHAIFRMPLYADDKACGDMANRFDLSVRGDGLDNEIGGETVDSLPMQRIDHGLAGAFKTRQESIGRQSHIMRIMGVTRGDRQIAPAMIEPARDLMNARMQ